MNHESKIENQTSQIAAVQSMLGDRNAVIPEQSEQPASDGDFELIT